MRSARILPDAGWFYAPDYAADTAVLRLRFELFCLHNLRFYVNYLGFFNIFSDICSIFGCLHIDIYCNLLYNYLA